MTKVGIRTNYIGNKELKYATNCVIIANQGISNSNWLHDRSLAPLWCDIIALRESKISKDIFFKLYREKVLSKLNPIDIYEKYKGKYLLCFEKDSEDCHRSELARWLREYGFNCEEGLF